MILTIAYITSRERPCFKWFVDSLRRQLHKDDRISITVVDALAANGRTEEKLWLSELGVKWVWTAPKPTIWQGEHRVTKDNWWAASNARNTAICLCQTDWIAFLDDRCVLIPGWLDGIRRAAANGYAVCGSYEKRVGMTAENGVIAHGGTIIGEDSRLNTYRDEQKQYGVSGPVLCAGEWMFGCSFALPLEWALQINGQDETCDGLSMEDVIFGLQLKNNGYPLCYDPSMKIVEDRTSSELGTAMLRKDKGVSPNDKSHAMLAMLRGSKHAMHQWDLRSIRNTVLAGGEFPIPEKKQYFDWYDGQPLSEL